MTPPNTAIIEAAIREHHVLLIDYFDRFGHRLMIRAEPYGFRTSRAGNPVLWVWNVEREKFEELVVRRMVDATDTGEVFVPRPEWEWLEEREVREV